MRPQRRNRLPSALEQLLEGQTYAGDALSSLLESARAAGSPTETTGLDQARAAFVVASTNASAPAFADLPTRRLKDKLIATKAAVIAFTVGLLAIGGVAYAASTGHFPGPLATDNPAVVNTQSSDADEQARHQTATSAISPAATATGTSSSSATAHQPSPSLIGLCNSWLARPHEHGSADTSSAFSVLTATAGEIDKVDDYCTALLTTPSNSPTASAQPSSSQPGNKPSTPPGQTKKPTD